MPSLMPKHIGSLHAPDYTAAVFDPNKFPELMRRVVRTIRNSRIEFNAIAASGNSGLLLAGALGSRLKVPVLAVRRGNEGSHDTRKVNGFFHQGRETRYFIVDDLISSGATVRRIIEEITRAKYDAKCVGIVTYDSEYGRPFEYRDWSVTHSIPTFFARKPAI